MPSNPLRNLPSVHELLESPAVRSLLDRINRNAVVSTVKTVLEEVRHEVWTAAADRKLPSAGDLAERITRRIVGGEPPAMHSVINATGQLLGNGLGGPPLAEEAIAELAAASRDYISLDVDAATGQAARREADVEALLQELTGAEAATVIGNHAGADLLTHAALGRDDCQRILRVLDDGAMIDLAPFGVPNVPVIRDVIKTGVELVSLSGDTLLGGPPCGILLGRTCWIEKIERHPLMQTLRADKLTLAALAETLRLYRDPEKARFRIPLLQLLGASMENLRNRAERLAPQLAATPAIDAAEATTGVTHLQWGASPARELPTWRVDLRPNAMNAARLAELMRTATPPILAPIKDDRVILDLRSVFPRQDMRIVEALDALAGVGSTESANRVE